MREKRERERERLGPLGTSADGGKSACGCWRLRQSGIEGGAQRERKREREREGRPWSFT